MYSLLKEPLVNHDCVANCLGEWANNRKHGYGVTTLKDGTRLAGKYKNNMLIASEKNSKVFVLRTSKMRDRIEGAIIASHRAADVATQKAEIAVARFIYMIS